MCNSMQSAIRRIVEILRELPSVKKVDQDNYEFAVSLSNTHKLFARYLHPAYYTPLDNSCPNNNQDDFSDDCLYTVMKAAKSTSQYIVAEHAERHPPIILQHGMEAAIVNFHKNVRLSKEGKVGERIELGINKNVQMFEPFPCRMKEGQTITALECSLYRASLHAKDAAITDFLLVKQKNKEYRLQRLEALFCVGQQLPFVRVPAPDSDEISSFMVKFTQCFVYETFRHAPFAYITPAILKDELLCKMFPPDHYGFLNRFLGTYGKKVCLSGDELYWRLKKHVRRDCRVCPEEYCLFLSTANAVARFNMRQKLSDAMQFQCEDGSEQTVKANPKDDLMAPWNTTSTFLSALKNECYLHIGQNNKNTDCNIGYGISMVQQLTAIKIEQLSFAYRTIEAAMRKVHKTDKFRNRVQSLNRMKEQIYLQFDDDAIDEVLCDFGANKKDIDKVDRIAKDLALTGILERFSFKYGLLSDAALIFAKKIKHKISKEMYETAYQRQVDRIFQNSIEMLSETNESPVQSSDNEKQSVQKTVLIVTRRKKIMKQTEVVMKEFYDFVYDDEVIDLYTRIRSTLSDQAIRTIFNIRAKETTS